MSEELKAIWERHFKRQAAMSVIGTDDSELLEAHADRATLLSALTAANARAEAAEASLAKVRDTYWQDDEKDVAAAMFHIANNALTRAQGYHPNHGAYLKGTPDGR